MNPDTITAYTDFLRGKAQLTKQDGFAVSIADMHRSLMGHQKDMVRWGALRGRALIAASFGLGKTRVQIELLRHAYVKTGKPVLVICPLGVKHQFIVEDGAEMGVRFEYVRTDDEAAAAKTRFLITNYERVRDGNISERTLSTLGAVSLDEGAILGNLGTKTQDQFNILLAGIPYRWVATATPAPNDYRQLIYFADFLDVMDMGQALTRFFGRNPDKAGDLQLMPHMEKDFWLWVAQWCLFVDKPSDLGHSDEGYVMPELGLHWHRLTADHEKAWRLTDQNGQAFLFKDTAAGITQAMKEKRDSLEIRVSEALKVVVQYLGVSTFSKGNQDGDTARAQQGILREEQGEGEGARSALLPREQGKDGSREEEGVQRGISQDSQRYEEEADGGTKSGMEPAEAREVRQRSRVQRTRKAESQRKLESESTRETDDSTESKLRNDAGAIRGDASSSGRGMRDLRSKGTWNEEVGQTAEISVCGSRSSNRRGSGDSLPSMQHGAGSVSGQPESAIEGSGVSDQLIIWCNLNDEQSALEKGLRGHGYTVSSIYGSLSPEEAEHRLYEWKEKRTQVLLTKPVIFGSGVNLQQAHIAIYVGLDFKFRDFIQSVHRLQRYGQQSTVEIHCIHTDAEDHVVDTLLGKWRQHDEMVATMRAIVQEYGLTNEALQSEMRRSIGVTRQQATGQFFKAVNNDCVLEVGSLEDNSVDEIVTSIPFGNHYEYVASLNDFGHNPTDNDFWLQMDFLIPELLRVLKPGRMVCIHAKDRLLYGHQTLHGMMEVDYFTHDCARAFRKHGFVAYGEIFIPTDVVRENNSTNRLGWSENCKDGSKMGVGLSEKVLLFRKPQTDKTRSYADEPVRKDKAQYSRGRWQVDAHSLWRSNGHALETPADNPDLLATMDGSQVFQWYRDWSKDAPYDYRQHVTFNEAMGDRLPAKFMLMPPQAPAEYEDCIWTDILFMRTLNMSQAKRRVEKHLCPLPLDIVERLIIRFSNPGELILDPFAGLGTVPVVAIEQGRRAIGCELNPTYFDAMVRYCQEAEIKRSAPTLFDMEAMSLEATA